jgi:hypothetical protein
MKFIITFSMKTESYEMIILPGVLYYRESWSVTQGADQR